MFTKLMLPEFGHFALILALSIAFVQATLPIIGAKKNNVRWMALARSCAYSQFAFILLAFLILMIAFVINDFTVAYVAQNDSISLPLLYKICGVWGAHEGSILLWILILNFWTVLVARFSRSLPLPIVANALAVLAWISIGFLLFSLLTSNAFMRYLPYAPMHGHSLDPLLQDPGMALHPPMLYMGYVGFAVAYAFAMAALIAGKLDQSWARWARPWTLIPWCFLTLGITLGSWWSYRELGWGGWWFWDPVENASFLPWLVGTALIHSLAVTEKRDAFKGWTVLLAISAFALSLIGTFLVRSGILVSVHAFANDPKRGIFLLWFLAIVICCSFILYSWRAIQLSGRGQFRLLSRETFLLVNNVFLFIAMITVLLGTLYPLILDSLHLGRISVGPPYFNHVFVPLFIPILLMISIGPHCRWGEMSISALAKKIQFTLLLSIILGLILPYWITSQWRWSTSLVTILLLWIVLSNAQVLWDSYRQRGRWRALRSSQWGMFCAHFGLAITAMGIAYSNAYTVTRMVKMKVGDSVQVGPYQFQFSALNNLTGPNYRGAAGDFVVFKDGKAVAKLQAQKRLYTVSRMVMTEAAIDAGVFRDLYLTLGNPIGQHEWLVHAYYKPFIRWIWAGGIFMLCGGILAAIDRRYQRQRQLK